MFCWNQPAGVGNPYGKNQKRKASDAGNGVGTITGTVGWIGIGNWILIGSWIWNCSVMCMCVADNSAACWMLVEL